MWAQSFAGIISIFREFPNVTDCESTYEGDDHSIMIYYPSYAGGGMKALFRKVSSMFHNIL